MSTTSLYWLFFDFQVPNGLHLHRRFRLCWPRKRSNRRLTASVLALNAYVLGCGSFDMPGERASTDVELGHAAFALTAETAGKAYALRDAQFVITGSESVTLESGDTPEETTLSVELPSGAYSVELTPGYRLVEVTSAGDIEVQASLESPNPQSTIVNPEQTTTVTYLFRTAGKPVAFGPGNLAIAIGVEEAEAPGLVISEFMVNPSALSDTRGEWIEIVNTSDTAVSLDGCRLLRDGSGFTIEGAHVVPPNGFFTFANGAAPGFSPAYVYSGLTLPNSAPFTLSLECNGALVDAVRVDPSSWPLAAGISAALSATALSSSKNDSPNVWCLSTKLYEVDFGTPGSANDPCAP